MFIVRSCRVKMLKTSFCLVQRKLIEKLGIEAAGETLTQALIFKKSGGEYHRINSQEVLYNIAVQYLWSKTLKNTYELDRFYCSSSTFFKK